MPDVFLSYSREDQPTARRFAEGLTREGFSVWWDQSLDAGESFDMVTEQALKDAKAVVVLWSKKAVDSRWVRAEATQADRFGTLVPVTIEPCDRPIMFELTHTADLSGWNGDVAAAPWRTFIDGLRRTVGKGAASPPATAPVATASRPFPRTALTWAAIAAALVLAVGSFWHFQGRLAKTSPTASITAASIAVLPFQDLSEGKDQEYFADGIAEEILNSLAQIRDLQVTGRTSSFHFKGRNEDLRVIGEQLNVEHLLEGSVRKDGDQLRITAQLVKAQDGYHLWSRTYDRPVADVFRVQEDIARDVAQALQVKFGVGELGETLGMTRSIEAYESYLKGIALHGNGNYEGAIAAFELAVEQDPDFGLAWVQLLQTRRILSQASNSGPTPEMQHARDEVGRLMPDSVLVRTEEANASLERLDYKEAARLLGAARVLAGRQTRDTVGINNLDHDEGIFLQGLDSADRALAVYARYLTRNPLSTSNEGDVAFAYAAAGREADARQEILRVFARLDAEGRVGPSSHLTGRLIALNDVGQPGMSELLTRIASEGRDKLLLDLLDRPDAARRELQRPMEPSSNVFGDFVVAAWAAHYGEPDLTLDYLRRMSRYESGRAHWLLPVLWQPLMKDVRKLPGFKDLVRELGLVAYWRVAGWGEHCKPISETDFECN